MPGEPVSWASTVQVRPSGERRTVAFGATSGPYEPCRMRNPSGVAMRADVQCPASSGTSTRSKVVPSSLT